MQGADRGIEHLHMWTGRAGDRTANPMISGRPDPPP